MIEVRILGTASKQRREEAGAIVVTGNKKIWMTYCERGLKYDLIKCRDADCSGEPPNIITRKFEYLFGVNIRAVREQRLTPAASRVLISTATGASTFAACVEVKQ